MAAQGRKNVRGRTGVRFKARYDRAKDKAMIRNVTSEFIAYGKVKLIKKFQNKFKRNRKAYYFSKTW